MDYAIYAILLDEISFVSGLIVGILLRQLGGWITTGGVVVV
jgi:hypothetical protein